MLFFISCSTETDNTQYRICLNEGWQLFSSDSINADGSFISSPDFDNKFGYTVKVPATVMNGLIQNGLFPDIFEPFVLEKMDKTPYEIPWWYRKVFRIDALSDLDFYQITFEGLNYKANIWLNGMKIADKDSVQGSYGVWNFDITQFLHKGDNMLAVEIIPPVFGEDVHMGFVDWNPTPPDRLMGIYRDVILSHTGPLSMRHSNVVSKVDKNTLKSAELTISTVLTNHTGHQQNGTLIASFNNIQISQEVQLQANEIREVFLSPSDFDELKINNPKLWWPNNMGEQALYDLKLTLRVNNEKSDEENFRFGIREIEDFWNESGFRGFMVNGQKVLLRSAGWVDDIFLGDSDKKVEAMVKYAKHMNLNSLRFEGFWGKNRTIMDMADECGLLLIFGWSAHWEWEGYIGIPHDDYVTIRGEEAEILHTKNYRDQVLWRRRHPSVAIWTYGSDKLPRPSLEIKLNKIMAEIDTTRPILSYCGGSMLMGDDDPRQSVISGPTGVKMEGPYDWVPPVYWYVDKQYGGAFGFNTEVGPGPQIPPLPSIKKMIPKESLWPIDSVWLYYSGRGEFENLDRFLSAFNARYGESNDLETFLLKNQISSYEAIRPMFESFAVNKFNSTGVVQWMYNSAWPTLYWQLFDYYLMPNGAFYGTKKASSPVLPIYNYGDHGIYVNNDKKDSLTDISLQIKIFDINSNLLFDEVEKLDIGPNQSKKVLNMPEVDNLSSTFFLDLRLMDDEGKSVENNFYWLSTKPDIPDFEKSTWYWTPNKQHADFKALNSIEKTEVNYDYSISTDKDGANFEVTIHNPTNKIAFFLEFMLVDKETNEPVLPVYWSDNYISLLPGEKRILTVAGNSSQFSNPERMNIVIQGFNLK
jgi:exo-1,4-beta-D-glucosaminidase